MRDIITIAELSQLAKPANGNETDLQRCIKEAEMFDIIPAIGAELYNAIAESAPLYSAYDELLNGGTYTDTFGKVQICAGLKKALAYFVESRFMRSANVQITKFGAVVKQDEYSDNNNTQRVATESNYLKSCGEEIMVGVKGYILANKNNEGYNGYYNAPTNNGRQDYVRVRTLGD